MMLGSAMVVRSMPDSGTLFKALAELPAGSWKADLSKPVF